MPQIYKVVNHHNLLNGIEPYYYIGSDQNDDPKYLGSSKELQSDISKLGKENFEKITLRYFDTLDNRSLRKLEAEILQEHKVRTSKEYYNKSERYSPGCGVKGMKHKKPKVVSEKWKQSRRGFTPSEETRKIWREQRVGRRHTESTKHKMSQSRTGVKNANALAWEVTTPAGTTVNVTGLRSWCSANGHNYYRVYRQADGFKLVKYGQGKGGRNHVTH